MIEDFKVAAILEIKGNFNQKLLEFAKATDKLSINVNRLEKQVLRFSTSLNNLKLDNPFSKMNASLELMNKNLNDVTAKSAALSMSGGVHGIGKRESKGMGFGEIAKSGTALAMGSFGALPIAGMIAAGIGVESYKAQSGYERELMKFQMQGFSKSDVASADKFVMGTHIKGVSNLDMLRSFVDAAMVTHSASMAKQLSPTLAKYSFANKQLLGKGFGAVDDQNLISFAEMRGKGNVAETKKYLGIGEQMLLGEGGRIKSEQLRSFLVRSRIAGYSLNEKAFYEAAPLIQEMRGNTVGVGLRMGYQQLIGLTGMSNQKGALLTKMGFLKPGFITHDPWGHVVKHKFGALKDKYAEMYQKNPFDFIESFVRHSNKMGYTSEDQLDRLASFSFSPRFAQIVAGYIKQKPKIERALRREQLIKHPYTKSQDQESAQIAFFVTSTQNFSKAMGKLTEPAVIGGFKTLTFLVDQLTNALNFLGKSNVQSTIGSVGKGIVNAATGGLSGSVLSFLHLSSLSQNSSANNAPVMEIVHDPHAAAHAMMPEMARMASKPVNTGSNISLFLTRIAPILNNI